LIGPEEGDRVLAEVQAALGATKRKAARSVKPKAAPKKPGKKRKPRR
jgi:hypothetical protein